jgi:hypothetical protein
MPTPSHSVVVFWGTLGGKYPKLLLVVAERASTLLCLLAVLASRPKLIHLEEVPIIRPPALNEAGIDKKQSSRSQNMAFDCSSFAWNKG